MTRLTTGRSLVGIAITIAFLSLAFTFPAETVDFSRVPDQDLKFKVTETSKIKIEGKYIVGEQEMESSQTITGKEIFTQTYTRVKDGKILEVEREYEDAGQKIIIEMERLPEPQEREMANPLAWKHIRARWSEDEEVTYEVKEEDSWKKMEDNLRDRLNAKDLMQPKFPLPKGEKKVGDTWEVSIKDLKAYFGDALKSSEEEEVELDGTTKCELTEIKTVKEVKCAVIKFNLDISFSTTEGGPTPQLTQVGEVLYSLDHHIIFGQKGTGSLKIEGEMEQMGQTIELSMSGKVTSELKVKILDKDSDE